MMATLDPAEEWNRLSALYSEMGDVELQDLQDSFEDLTDIAQDALKEELKKRQLWSVLSPAEPSIEAPSRERKRPSAQDLHVGGVTVREYDTLNEARLAGYVLDLEGIEAIIGDGQGNFDLRPPFVRVAPKDAEKADMILLRPITPQIRADFEATLHLPDFELPKCPQCSGEEVILEAFEPNNVWVCDLCGHTWQDADVASHGSH
jgi:hypothetical protein